MNFKDIRNKFMKAKVIGHKCRELSPYYYSANGAKGPRKREAGEVAYVIRRLHRAAFGELAIQKYHSKSWGGDWPRTKESIEAETIGVNNFWQMVKDLKGISL